jgi:hypothetical protein
MRNINPCNVNPSSEAQCKGRFVTLALAISLLVSAQGIAQLSAPIVRRVQQVQRETQAAVRFTQRLYRFYKLSEEGAASLQSSN